jgi:hypothetical protein
VVFYVPTFLSLGIGSPGRSVVYPAHHGGLLLSGAFQNNLRMHHKQQFMSIKSRTKHMTKIKQRFSKTVKVHRR